MSQLKNILSLYLVITVFPLISASCQSKNEKEFVWFVVQPEVEIGKSIDFSIYFEEKPDSVYTNVKEINGLELTDNDNLDEVRVNTEIGLTDDDGKVKKMIYQFYTYAKPTKLGRIDFPIMTVVHNGKEYKSKPFHINVVDKIVPDKNDVKVIWSTNKSIYKKNDTIKLSLYEYSKFYQSTRIHSSASNISLTGKNNQISINADETIDNVAGIDDFEQLLDQKFEITDVDWNMSNNSQSMEKIENEVYIKRLILELSLIAKTSQNFIVGPSEYDYYIYKNNADYFSKYVPNDKGSYNVTQNGSTILKIKSNKLTIKIE